MVEACAAGQLGAASPTVLSEIGVGTRASFVVAAPSGLLGLDERGRMLGHVVRLPPGATASAPTVDPSGQAIAFVLSKVTGTSGFGSDVYTVNFDGSDLRPRVTHERANVFYASPSFDRSGLLYVHRRAAPETVAPSAAGIYVPNDDSVERIDLRTGERRTFLTNAAEPSVSPDGSRVVFVQVDRGDKSGLGIASRDGDAQPFLKTRDTFTFLQAPRISPTGREIVFSSAGRLQNKFAPDGQTAAFAGPSGRLAHLDIPSELFLAPIEGTSLRSIATTRDDVVPAWSIDGSKIAYVAVGTFYVVSAADGKVLVKTEQVGFLYGDPAWLR
jgi:Tol biopolymer transport system component